MISNYLFPLPLPLHIGFCVVSVLFFGLMYARKKRTSHLLLTFAVPSTLLIYACKSELAFNILAVEEMLLFALILISLFLDRKREAAREAEAAALASAQNDETNE